MKLPSILFLLGCNAKKNEGMPIVNIAISEICAGSSGYVTAAMIEHSAIMNEKIFFTRKRLAERSMLLTTRLPSSTTDGIFEKSDSRSTTCAACAAASLPDAIAILQSASLSARTSLTPSPVMATVFPCFLSAPTSCLFCSGDTRPNTTYCLAAS